jgi:hypothetical protein
LAYNDDTSRRALVVALGLLGETVSPAEAVPDRTDLHLATAAALATVLVDPTPETAVPTLIRLMKHLRGDAARETVATAISRVQDGYFLTAVEQ